MSLEIRPQAALYPPPYIFFRLIIERGANAVGMSIPHLATTEGGDQERSLRSQLYKALFLYGGGGCNVARGLISREINELASENWLIKVKKLKLKIHKFCLKEKYV